MKFYRSHVLVAEDTKSLLIGAKRIEEALIESIQRFGLQDEIRVIPTGSLGYEDQGVAIAVYPEGIVYCPLTLDNIPFLVEEHLLKGRVVSKWLAPFKNQDVSRGTYETQYIKDIQERFVLQNVGIINPENIDEYIAQDGYVALEKALFSLKPEEIIQEVKTSELRGRGGAGFPTGMKWDFTAKSINEMKYVICNADEGEPGTFKDREIMEGDPHKLLEGMMIAGYATGGKIGYIYIRGEYDLSIRRLEKAILDARQYGLLGNNILGTSFSFDIFVHKGAGAYVCGEETALIESIEGKRGEPRKKPPYPPTAGLWMKPTVVNNVETLANIPLIIAKGGNWFKGIGVEGSRGTKLFSLMGDLNWKGVVEIPFGTTIGDIVNNIGQGIKGDKKLKGIILGGSSGFLILPPELNTAVDFQSLARIEAGPGSGSIVAMDETRCIVDILLNIAQFFRHESCGKCTPCRVGNDQIVKILDRISYGEGELEDLTTLEDLAKTMNSTSFCPLGQAAPNILIQALKKFREEILIHIQEKKCPVHVCPIETSTVVSESNLKGMH
ncbi:NADH-quinone oxidoreductase subunit NuoF [bacterium]|nr:NADH-quinone oxidoreductase subunit NuoF [bacterium]